MSFRSIFNLKFFYGIAVLSAILLVLPMIGFGQEEFAREAGLPTADLQIIVAKIIRAILGLLGILLVCIIIYGGFVWMTAGGDEEKIVKAKGILTNAIIGLAIILTSFVITQFLLTQLQKAVGLPVGEGEAGPPATPYYPGVTSNFTVTWVDPAPNSQNVALCRLIQAGFNEEIESGTINSQNILIQIKNGQPSGGVCTSSKECRSGVCFAGACQGDVVSGTFTINGKAFSFDPSRDLEMDAIHRVLITSAVRSKKGLALAMPKEWFFTTGRSTDTTPPTVEKIFPEKDSRDICRLAPVEVKFSEPMDIVSLLKTDSIDPNDTTDKNSLHLSPKTTGFYKQILNSQTLMAEPRQAYQANTIYQVTADSDVIRDACGNYLDGNKNQLAEKSFGGDDYIWQFTTSAVTECKPEITNIRPQKGYYNDTIVIEGRYFTAFGDVIFNNQVYTNSSQQSTGRCFDEQKIPQAICLNEDNWGNSRIVLRVPSGGGASNGAMNGLVAVQTTQKSNGIDFEVLSPHIEWLSPQSGGAGQFVTLAGANFGEQKGKVFFRKVSDPAQKVEAAYPCGAGGWKNNQIIIEVPSGLSKEAWYLQIQHSADHWSNLAIFQFDDSLPGPGLCAVTPAEGRVGAEITLTGQRFGSATSTVKFGGIEAGLKAWEDAKIISLAPNLTPAKTSVWLTVNKRDSNSLSFTVLPTAPAAKPVIESIQPAEGPVGQYITITGRNFGRSGLVWFVQNEKKTAADVKFPAGCAKDFWQEQSIVVKVPSGMKGGASQVLVKTQVESDARPFTITKNAPTPGLCSLQPNNGPVGLPVTLAGENFGELKGTVQFHEKKDAGITTWTKNKIEAAVPKDTVSGSVYVWQAGDENNEQRRSNGVPFTVSDCRQAGCARQPTLPVCCKTGPLAGSCQADVAGCGALQLTGGYSWWFTTGEIPLIPQVKEIASCNKEESIMQSPSPWKNSFDACTNINIRVQFNTKMDKNSFVWNPVDSATSTIIVEKCIGVEKDKDPCEKTEKVSADLKVQDFDNTSSYLLIEPKTTLATSTLYRVTLRSEPGTAIKGEKEKGGFMLDGDFDQMQGGNYVWRFKTRTDDKPCAIKYIEVTPITYLMDDLGDTTIYKALPTEEKCSILQNCGGEQYEWKWESRVITGEGAQQEITIVDHILVELGRVEKEGKEIACQVQAKAKAESVPDKIQVTAMTWPKEKGQMHQDYGLLTIDFTDPKIIKKWPDCPTACLNSAIGVQFNTAMIKKEAEDSSNYILWDISTTPTTTVLITKPLYSEDTEKKEYQVTFAPAGSLKPETKYRVVVKGNMHSESNVLLTGLNYNSRTNVFADSKANNAYAWDFKTQDTDRACAIDRTEILPREAILPYITAKTTFYGFPYSAPDQCSIVGQMLKPTDYQWTWTTKPEKIVGLQRPTSTVIVEALGVERGASSSSATIIGKVETHSCEAKDACGRATVICNYLSTKACPVVEEKLLSLGLNGCCYPEPQIKEYYPESKATNVCRNTVISLRFDREMAEQSIKNNIFLIGAYTDNCPAHATTTKLYKLLPKEWLSKTYTSEKIKYCTLPANIQTELVIEGTATTTKANLLLSRALESLTDYAVLVRGDENLADNAAATSVLDLNGAAINGHKSWGFQTGTGVCEINNVSVDPGQKHFQGRGEEQAFIAVASYKDRYGKIHDIQSTGDYKWEWEWGATPTGIINVPQTAVDHVVVTPIANGSSDLLATAKAPNQPKPGKAKITVFLCENPWPAVKEQEIEGKVIKSWSPFQDPKYNFELSYCRDAGNPGISDDLPDLGIPKSQDLIGGLKEYLLVASPTTDAIGLRIYDNNEHYSPRRWYLTQELKGSPQAVKVNDEPYLAIREGRTTYINAANVVPVGEENLDAFTNIYLLSYNENATPETQQIYNQLINNWNFNTNLNDGLMTQYNNIINRYNNLTSYNNITPLPTASTTELKLRLGRDAQRLTDLQDIKKSIKDYKKYPALPSGTYIPGMTVSRWPSWQQTLGAELGATLPFDPLNAFGTDCAAGYEQATCWNVKEKTYQCPSGSHLYQYRYLPQTDDYELGAILEGLPARSWQKVEEFNLSGDICERGYAVAVVCGDGKTNPANEECDPPGERYPTDETCPGTDLWGRTYQGKFVRICTTQCKKGEKKCEQISLCGNKIIETGEQCDAGIKEGIATLRSYKYKEQATGREIEVLPGISKVNDVSAQYACLAPQCQWTGGWCGDDDVQEKYGEQCEHASSTTYAITTKESSADKQYGCYSVEQASEAPEMACRFFGGYCGDNATSTTGAEYFLSGTGITEDCDGDEKESCIQEAEQKLGKQFQEADKQCKRGEESIACVPTTDENAIYFKSDSTTTYQWNLKGPGKYRFWVETSNYRQDLSKVDFWTIQPSKAPEQVHPLGQYGITHHLKIFVGDEKVGELYNLASGPDKPQLGELTFETKQTGDTTIKIVWDNDWCVPHPQKGGCGGGTPGPSLYDSNLVIYQVGLDAERVHYCGQPGAENACKWKQGEDEWSACQSKQALACGNGLKDEARGEQCDDGGKGRCMLGAAVLDKVCKKNEECDSNRGEYCDLNADECNRYCRFTYCGDGTWQKTNGEKKGEECDKGWLGNWTQERLDKEPCPYGRTCNYCTTQCKVVTKSGGWCGDEKRQTPNETCDFGARETIFQASFKDLLSAKDWQWRSGVVGNYKYNNIEPVVIFSKKEFREPVVEGEYGWLFRSERTLQDKSEVSVDFFLGSEAPKLYFTLSDVDFITNISPPPPLGYINSSSSEESKKFGVIIDNLDADNEIEVSGFDSHDGTSIAKRDFANTVSNKWYSLYFRLDFNTSSSFSWQLKERDTQKIVAEFWRDMEVKNMDQRWTFGIFQDGPEQRIFIDNYQEIKTGNGDICKVPQYTSQKSDSIYGPGYATARADTCFYCDRRCQKIKLESAYCGDKICQEKIEKEKMKDGATNVDYCPDPDCKPRL